MINNTYSPKLKDVNFVRANNYLESWHNQMRIRFKFPKPKFSLSLSLMRDVFTQKEEEFKKEFFESKRKELYTKNQLVSDDCVLVKTNKIIKIFTNEWDTNNDEILKSMMIEVLSNDIELPDIESESDKEIIAENEEELENFLIFDEEKKISGS